MNTASGNENIDAMIKRRMQGKTRNEMSRAYLVVPPDFLSSIPMFTEPLEVEPMKFRMFQDYGVKMMGVPMIISTYMDFGTSSAPIVKPVVWKDVPKPAIVPTWQWCVVVACLAALIVATGNVF